MENYNYRRLKSASSPNISPNPNNSTDHHKHYNKWNDIIFLLSFFFSVFLVVILVIIVSWLCKRLNSRSQQSRSGIAGGGVGVGDGDGGGNNNNNTVIVINNDNDDSRGVNSSLIQQLPVVIYDKYIKKEEGLIFSICVMDFEDTEFLRLLPKCEHAFHSLCIEEWLKICMTCPVCRSLVEDTDVNLIPYMNITRQELQVRYGSGHMFDLDIAYALDAARRSSHHRRHSF
ncbi:E3 ubiquitin-protein ligase, ATL family [Zostera marina]|uniref:RING-type E3 ubiquitin transferase n=1 Tax=Zostera marina TaxID=29655 RepID=A0A0K9P1S3_ZOSMR|nr:E3 ubiquitin-protein ligase, ATL family [Zostera marina]